MLVKASITAKNKEVMFYMRAVSHDHAMKKAMVVARTLEHQNIIDEKCNKTYFIDTCVESFRLSLLLSFRGYGFKKVLNGNVLVNGIYTSV